MTKTLEWISLSLGVESEEEDLIGVVAGDEAVDEVGT